MERNTLPVVARGNLVLLTEQRRTFGAFECEACPTTHPGGTAHGVIVEEPDEVHWLLWVFADGFSISDESSKGPIAVCSPCQANPLIQTLRFAEPATIAHDALTTSSVPALP